jgi:large subunit ribosomal protein L4
MADKQEIKYKVRKIDGTYGAEGTISLNAIQDGGRYLVHRAFVAQSNKKRQGTASTKTRSEIRGGGKKPWRQKGTGNARAGSSRSPLWVGGGVIFGPKPRLVNKKINKKERRLAILSALYLKKQQLTFIEETNFDQFTQIKTKMVLDLITKLGLNLNAKILFILTRPNKNFWLASRNLKNIEVTSVNCLNLKQLLQTSNIIISNNSLKLINTKYGK